MNYIPKIEYVDLIDGSTKVIIFDSPPEGDPFNEEIQGRVKVTKSNNGRRQVQYNYAEQFYKLEFLFQSEAVKLQVEELFTRHALRGGKINYFSSSDEVDFIEFYVGSRSLSFKRPIPSAIEGEFEYDFSFSLERVL